VPCRDVPCRADDAIDISGAAGGEAGGGGRGARAQGGGLSRLPSDQGCRHRLPGGAATGGGCVLGGRGGSRGRGVGTAAGDQQPRAEGPVLGERRLGYDAPFWRIIRWQWVQAPRHGDPIANQKEHPQPPPPI
jgi:hypothetical protein